MKKVLYLVILTLFISIPANAQLDYTYKGKIKTGKTPVQMIWTDKGPVVYCAGVDANFNGQMDDGDEAPSLWLLTYDNFHIKGSQKLLDLDFRTPSVPARNFFDPFRNVLFIANTNSIDTVSFTFDNSEVKAIKGRFLESTGNVTGISSSEKQLFLSVRKSLTEGFVYVYDFESKMFTDTITAGTGVQMNEYQMMTNQLIILNEGTFGKDDGSIQLVTFKDDKPDTTNTIPIGGLPNHFLVDFASHKIFVVCNVSNNIIIINENGDKDTIHLDLPEYNGPREISIFPVEAPDMLYAITTYDGKVFIIDSVGNSQATFDAHGKAENATMLGPDFLILTPYESGSYNPADEISFYSKEISDVEDITESSWTVFPNPASDFISVSHPSNRKIQYAYIINSLGQRIQTLNADALDNISVESLSTGLFFLRIVADNKIETIPFIVR